MTGLIAHEWIERVGGAERVLDSFADIYPDADLLCLWNDVPDRFEGREVAESVLARTPLRRSKALALPTMPLIWRKLRKHADYDWMLVSSHLFAHHARITSVPAERKFVYVHTPARYIWSPELDARGRNPLVRAVAPLLRALDARRARANANVAANSEFVRKRIKDSWGVDATVIHPPVDVAKLQAVANWSTRLSAKERSVINALPAHYVLGASRFVGYKCLDLVIAAGRASGIPVVIAGSGPEERRLRSLAEDAGVPVHFVIEPSDSLLSALMQRAAVYVFPAVEDFGIMPVEAMALGTPVVINTAGGTSESVIDGVTGIAVADFDDETELRNAIERALVLDGQVARVHARVFDTPRFQSAIRSWMSTQPAADASLVAS
ncbi:glycosyltransferase [Leifsonia aquatica]|uniref:glycosyltransferase n=1 Tax=Leifsonia aquatica TaxID=144185 RepID=UPI0004A7A5C1|nr:glycosyltransferase [Leifsonia aquatica]